MSTVKSEPETTMAGRPAFGEPVVEAAHCTNLCIGFYTGSIDAAYTWIPQRLPTCHNEPNAENRDTNDHKASGHSYNQ